jgi:S-adenosylmethionine synthetase
MTNKDFVFTSESVSEGHPDKMCDQISDAVLDAHLSLDPDSRVACETLVKNDLIVIAGEITSKGKVDYEDVARRVALDIGYDDPAKGFDGNNCEVLVRLVSQSPNISQGVTEGEGLHKEQGAGDQGMMFGYACDETDELMPLPIKLAHDLVSDLADIRKSGKVPLSRLLRPDSKSQVSVQYRDGRPQRVSNVVVSTQHSPDISHDDLERDIINSVIREVVPSRYLDSDTEFLVNPTGSFEIGGPQADAGLTGRKIIVDTYGGWARHGGGAFSGKDPSKVDRSAAYAARYVAKNVVAAGLAEKCEVQLAYAIGVARPVSILVDTFGTGKLSGEELVKVVREVFDLRPKGIIDALLLKRPIFRATAAYGHFGRPAGADGSFSWEKTDRAEALARLARTAAASRSG